MGAPESADVMSVREKLIETVRRIIKSPSIGENEKRLAERRLKTIQPAPAAPKEEEQSLEEGPYPSRSKTPSIPSYPWRIKRRIAYTSLILAASLFLSPGIAAAFNHVLSPSVNQITIHSVQAETSASKPRSSSSGAEEGGKEKELPRISSQETLWTQGYLLKGDFF